MGLLETQFMLAGLKKTEPEMEPGLQFSLFQGPLEVRVIDAMVA